MLRRLRIYYYNYKQKRLEHKFAKGSVASTVNGVCLMAHHVTDSYLPDAPSTCQCTISTFQSCIMSYIEKGYTFMPMNGAVDIIENNEATKFAVLSFDDVPEDMYQNAYPFLKSQSIPFTLFLANEYIGKRGYLSLEQIKELQQTDLCTIGAHTKSHQMLRRSKNVHEEIAGCKEELEELLDCSVNYFAYPYGSLQAVDKKSVYIAKAHYRAAFSTVYADINDTSSAYRWFLPRKYIK